MNIIFGKPTTVKEIVEKFPELAVVTVEAVKEAKKSRRTIFNKEASEVLNLERGVANSIMFGWVTDGDDKYIILSDITGLAESPTDVVFKTSRNPVSWGDTDQYKGKAISSGQLVKHINSHLGESEEEREYVLSPFDNPEAADLGYDLYRLVPIADFTAELDAITEDATAIIGEVHEDLTAEEVSLDAQIDEAPVADPEPVADAAPVSTQGVGDYF